MKPTLAAAAQFVGLFLSARGEASLYDIVVYGDSSGAVTAAISAQREGRSVILVNPTACPRSSSRSRGKVRSSIGTTCTP